MPYFIEPGTASTDYTLEGESQARTISNQPVNLALCTQLLKSFIQWPGMAAPLQSIRFQGCDAEWVYPDQASRDADLARISAIQTAGA